LGLVASTRALPLPPAARHAPPRLRCVAFSAPLRRSMPCCVPVAQCLRPFPAAFAPLPSAAARRRPPRPPPTGGASQRFGTPARASRPPSALPSRPSSPARSCLARRARAFRSVARPAAHRTPALARARPSPFATRGARRCSSMRRPIAFLSADARACGLGVHGHAPAPTRCPAAHILALVLPCRGGGFWLPRARAPSGRSSGFASPSRRPRVQSRARSPALPQRLPSVAWPGHLASHALLAHCSRPGGFSHASPGVSGPRYAALRPSSAGPGSAAGVPRCCSRCRGSCRADPSIAAGSPRPQRRAGITRAPRLLQPSLPRRWSGARLGYARLAPWLAPPRLLWHPVGDWGWAHAMLRLLHFPSHSPHLFGP